MTLPVLHLKNELDKMLELLNTLEVMTISAINMTNVYDECLDKKDENEEKTVLRFQQLYKKFNKLISSLRYESKKFVNLFQEDIFTRDERNDILHKIKKI